MPEKPTLYRANGPSRKQVSERGDDRKADKRFYGTKRWRTLREYVLSEQPLCVRCYQKGLTVAASQVDHIIDRKVEPSREYEYENLQSLCHSCHSKKTMRTKR